MAGVVLKASLFPYRLSLKAKESQELSVEIGNESGQTKYLSLDIALPGAVSFDKSGLNRRVNKKLEPLKPGDKKSFLFPVYPTSRGDVGAFDGKLVVQEHYANFDYVTGHYSKELVFRIVN